MFDTTKDKQCSKGYKTRYIIYYNNSDTNVSITIPNNAIYVIFDGVKFNSNSIFNDKRFLQAVKFINNAQYTSISTNNMFRNCNSLQSITNLDTSKVTNMSSMFYGCTSLRNITNLDTSRVTNMSDMFRDCHSLQSVTKLNTSNVTNMFYMFYDCNSLRIVKELDMNKVTNASSMFSMCYLLINIDITNIATSLSLSSCTNLNHQMLIKILNALVDLTGVTSQKLTTGNNIDKLTDEDKAIIIEKNWTLVK